MMMKENMMKKYTQRLSMLMLFVALSLVASVSLSQLSFAEDKKEKSSESKALSIAVVDIQSLLSTSKAAKDIMKQAKTLRDKYQKEFEELEKDLRESEKKLIKDKANLKEDEFVKRRKSFEKQLIQAQIKVKKRRKDLEKKVGKATAELRKQILKAVATLSAERDYDLVISRQDVVIVSKDVDISDDVMDRLNDNVKKIKLD